MTEAEMKEHIQAVQDMLEGMQNQRNAHANECVQLAAQVKALQRKLDAKEKAAEPGLPLTNGHAAEVEARPS